MTRPKHAPQRFDPEGEWTPVWRKGAYRRRQDDGYHGYHGHQVCQPARWPNTFNQQGHRNHQSAGRPANPKNGNGGIQVGSGNRPSQKRETQEPKAFILHVAKEEGSELSPAVMQDFKIKKVLMDNDLVELDQIKSLWFNKNENKVTIKLTNAGKAKETRQKGEITLRTQLNGSKIVWKIRARTPKAIVVLKGMPTEVDAKEIEENLKTGKNVERAFKIGKSVWAIGMTTDEAPKQLNTLFGPRRTERYNPPPTRCTLCLKFGHKAESCTDKEKSCRNCGEKGHLVAECTNPAKCALCGGDHKATDRSCEIVKKSYAEAAAKRNLGKIPKNDQKDTADENQGPPQPAEPTNLAQLIESAVKAAVKPLVETIKGLTDRLETLEKENKEVIDLLAFVSKQYREDTQIDKEESVLSESEQESDSEEELNHESPPSSPTPRRESNSSPPQTERSPPHSPEIEQTKKKQRLEPRN